MMRTRKFNPAATGQGGLLGGFQDDIVSGLLGMGNQASSNWEEWMQDPVRNIRESLTDWPPVDMQEMMEYEVTEDDFMNAMDSIAPGAGLLGDVIGGLAGATKTSKVGGFDPRYDDRVLEQGRLNSLTYKHDNTLPDIPEVSILDYEGKPFVTTMADRTEGGQVIEQINNVPLDNPVRQHGGQNHMFDQDPSLWANAPGAAGQIQKLGGILEEATGEIPLLMPWRMAPTGSDFTPTTGEIMMSYAASNMPKRDRTVLNNAIKRKIPGWKGVENPDSVAQFRGASTEVRKALQDMMDTKFRNRGGLGIGEARLLISESSQRGAREGAFQNVGLLDTRGPLPVSGNPAYPTGIPGTPVGRLKEDIQAAQLLPDWAKARGIADPSNPSHRDYRSLQMKPFGGIITEELLMGLGL